MPLIDRRSFLVGEAGLLVAGRAAAQSHAGHGELYESLKSPGRIGLPESAAPRRRSAAITPGRSRLAMSFT